MTGRAVARTGRAGAKSAMRTRYCYAVTGCSSNMTGRSSEMTGRIYAWSLVPSREVPEWPNHD